MLLYHPVHRTNKTFLDQQFSKLFFKQYCPTKIPRAGQVVHFLSPCVFLLESLFYSSINFECDEIMSIELELLNVCRLLMFIISCLMCQYCCVNH